MKIVSLTLTGNNADLIEAAVASVADWVDACIVIDTGVTDESLAIASAIAGEKYVERKFEWVADFAAARNFSLEVAKEIGADWAIIIDTDERIHSQVSDIRGAIDSLVGDVSLVYHTNKSYCKEKLFRIPTTGKYIGATHEYFDCGSGIRTFMETIAFSEVPKTAAATLAKFNRDLEILDRLVKEEPTNTRWLFYLGETLKNLGNNQQAIIAYRDCANLNGWDEEAAWACYREAECWLALADYQAAINACAKGLTKHAGIAELAWLAAYASYYAGLNSQAIHWAHLSIAMGKHQGYGKGIERIGFQYPEAQYEKPYDVLRYALLRKGDAEGAKLAEQLYHNACETRLRNLGNNSVDRNYLI
jgi:glycosyltransferase involved in cell wall biosynthesis